MTEKQLKEYKSYLYARIKRLLPHIDNLDTEDNTIVCSCINTILDDIKQTVSCVKLKSKPSNN